MGEGVRAPLPSNGGGNPKKGKGGRGLKDHTGPFKRTTTGGNLMRDLRTKKRDKVGMGEKKKQKSELRPPKQPWGNLGDRKKRESRLTGVVGESIKKQFHGGGGQGGKKTQGMKKKD